MRAAVNGYFAALLRHDATGACAKMAPAFARALIATTSATPTGERCTVALKRSFNGLAARKNVKVPIRAIKVTGDRASAHVEASGTHGVTVQLVRSSGRWLLACCVGAQTDRLARRELRIPAASMEPTLHVGQLVSVDQRAYVASPPRIGDIVLIHPPQPNDVCAAPDEGADHDRPCSRSSGVLSTTLFVKRVVAGPGDRVALRAGRVILNGRAVAEPFIKACAGADPCDFPTAIVVPADSYFVLGDNRGQSDDSRFWGPMPRRGVVGRLSTP